MDLLRLHKCWSTFWNTRMEYALPFSFTRDTKECGPGISSLTEGPLRAGVLRV